MDAKDMKMNVLYPQDYVEPTKDLAAKEARYLQIADGLKARVKALVVDGPVAYDKLILALSQQGGPGGTYCWGRAIEEVDKEWHPTKFEPVVEELETPKEK